MWREKTLLEAIGVSSYFPQKERRVKEIFTLLIVCTQKSVCERRVEHGKRNVDLYVLGIWV